jgi:quinol-cytochrome oxidoreductase complex cytochrome b subunit
MKTFHDMYDFTGETLKSLKIEIYSPPNLIVKHDVFGYSYWYPENNLYSSNTFADQAISGYLLDLNYEDNANPKNETSIPIVVKAHLQRKDAFNSDSYVNKIINEHEEHNYQLETDTYQMDGLQARKDKFIYVGSYSIQ